MATNTTKLNLPRPDASDNFNRAAYNGLIDVIDANVGAKLDAKIETSKAGAANGVATLGADGKVPATQLSISDGSTTTKGIVQLEDSVTSVSTTKAATSKSVKTAYDLANGAIPSSQKGTTNGVATLGIDGKVPTTQLPTLASTANDIAIADANDYYTSTKVEGALAEIGQTLAGTRTSIVTTAQQLGVM